MFGEATSLTTGVRYTSDRQSVVGGAYNNFGQLAGTTADQHATFNKPTWRAALDHNFTPDLMSYVSYNRGFKSGVYNATAPKDPAVNPSVIDAYELGVKSQWLGGRVRLNGAAYYYKYNGVQLSLTIGPATHLLNAAKAQVKGADLDFEIIPVDRLTFSGGVSYADSKYTDFPNAPYARQNPAGGFLITPADGSGNRLIYTPVWTFTTGAQYSIPTQYGTYGMAVNYAYSGGYFGDPANVFFQPSYHLVNTSLDWTSSNDKWNVRLWAKNLNDAHYYIQYAFYSQTATASPAPPRTFGITLDYKLGRH